MDEAARKSWLIMDRMRQDPDHRAGDFLQAALFAAEQEGIVLDRETFRLILNRHGHHRSMPDSIVSFLGAYARRVEPKSALSLWSGDGSIALALSQLGMISSVAGVDISTTDVAIARHFDQTGKIAWTVSSPRKALAGREWAAGSIDLLVATPPFGMRRDSLDLPLPDGQAAHVSDEAGRVDFAAFAGLVSASGAAVLLTTQSLLWRNDGERTRQALAKVGLYLHAALSVRAGTFAPMTSMPAVLAVFKRDPSDRVFLAELPQDAGAQERLLDNMSSGKEGRTPEAGVLLPPAELAPFDALVARFDLQKALSGTGYPIVSLGDIALRILPPAKRGDSLAFEPSDNCFYVCRVGTGPPRLEPPEKTTRDWLQVTLDPEKAVAAFVARSLSSPLGRLARESLQAGTIPRISTADMTQVKLCLPPLESQYKALRLDTDLLGLQATVQQMQTELWTKPRLLPALSKRAAKLIPADDLQSWMDALPMPLSTVGRAYYARSDTRERVEALFHFFEATAEFQAAVLLSGLAVDGDYFSEVRETLLGSQDERRLYFENASIGSWINVCHHLSKHIRRVSSSAKGEAGVDRDSVLNWFGRPEPTWLDAVTNPALYNALDEARVRRNEWKGHGGAAGEAVMKSRLAELETLLGDVRVAVADTWQDAALVTPTNQMRYVDGVFETTVDVLMGNSLPLEQRQVVTSAALEEGYIHLTYDLSRSSLRLLPLVRMMPSPRTANNACYFYSRVEGSGVRYVSYYYEEDPDAVLPGTEPRTNDILAVLGLGQ